MPDPFAAIWSNPWIFSVTMALAAAAGASLRKDATSLKVLRTFIWTVLAIRGLILLEGH